MKPIAQENIIELAKLGHERAAELKASCGAADVRSLAQLISDLATQLEVQLVRGSALAAENSGLKNSDFYIALRTESDADILNDKHLTICYMSASATSKLDVNRIMPQQAEAKISAVEYWERVNLTVALIDSPDAHAAHKLSKIAGFTYDLEFMPHVTLGCGDTTKEHQNLVGKILTIGSPYIRIKESKRKTPDTDAFLAEVRAQGLERLAKAWYAIANETASGISISESSRLKYRQRADDVADLANKIRQEAAQ